MILHIPHSSVYIPVDVRKIFVLSMKGLEKELLRITDHFTNDLFQCPGAVRVVHKVSRLVVDPERFLDDQQEPMARKGMGAVYVKTTTGEQLRGSIDQISREKLIELYYRPHHQTFEQMVQRELEISKYALIVDCHSFPDEPLPYEDDLSSPRPDICLGMDRFHTPAALKEELIRHFQSYGYTVKVDSPFKGSIVPMRYYNRDERVRSVMIELNRKLYVDERTGMKNKGYGKLKNDLGKILQSICIRNR